jgi:hypothetical protein
MKTLIKFFIVAMFGIELLSPFLIGYLNQKENARKVYGKQEANDIALVKATSSNNLKDWEDIDFTDNNYSDSKTYNIKE